MLPPVSLPLIWHRSFGRYERSFTSRKRCHGLARGILIVCRACSTARRCKSSTQPDGGEELAKRKGVVVRRGLKEAWSKGASR
jgi:hypothetical protein